MNSLPKKRGGWPKGRPRVVGGCPPVVHVALDARVHALAVRDARRAKATLGRHIARLVLRGLAVETLKERRRLDRIAPQLALLPIGLPAPEAMPTRVRELEEDPPE